MEITKEQIIETISKMSVMEIIDLISIMEKKFGVSSIAMPQQNTNQKQEKVEEKTEFDVILKITGVLTGKISSLIVAIFSFGYINNQFQSNATTFTWIGLFIEIIVFLGSNWCDVFHVNIPKKQIIAIGTIHTIISIIFECFQSGL